MKRKKRTEAVEEIDLDLGDHDAQEKALDEVGAQLLRERRYSEDQIAEAINWHKRGSRPPLPVSMRPKARPGPKGEE
jgi:hypothetical protein